jgi:hypothetical protein
MVQTDRQAGHRWQYNTEQARCLLNKKSYKHTLRICNTYCFFTATMVTWTRLNVTLQEYCLSYICSCLLTLLFIFYLSLLHVRIRYFICILNANINHIEIHSTILPDSLTVFLCATFSSLCTGDLTLLKNVQGPYSQVPVSNYGQPLFLTYDFIYFIPRRRPC